MRCVLPLFQALRSMGGMLGRGWSLCFLRTRFVLTDPMRALNFTNHTTFCQSSLDTQFHLNTFQLNSSAISSSPNCVIQHRCCMLCSSCSAFLICHSVSPAMQLSCQTWFSSSGPWRIGRCLRSSSFAS